jgi:hypothetical protein
MRRTLLVIALLAAPLLCQAQAPVVLGTCIVENITEKDRNELGQWVFLSMAAHPETKQFSNIQPEAREEVFRAVGVMFTRLMTNDCAKQVRQAAITGGPPVVPSAIQFLTQIGVQELMRNREVLGTLSTFSRFADKERIDESARRH